MRKGRLGEADGEEKAELPVTGLKSSSRQDILRARFSAGGTSVVNEATSPGLGDGPAKEIRGIRKASSSRAGEVAKADEESRRNPKNRPFLLHAWTGGRTLP